MRVDNFSIYSVLKNEDAHPFLKDGLLVCADGLGGAGSTVHNIDRNKHPNLKDELTAVALCGMDELGALDKLADFIELELEPMVDDLADTSALWASRIAIMRFAYALGYSAQFSECDLSSDENRKRLSRFVGEGLTRVKESFSLERGRYGGQVVLPTTLAAIRYKTEGGKITAEAIWAGDSRCYALNKDGLFALSKDDEDSSGAITNLFASDEDAVLNYRRYTLDAPCVLLVVSDGAFDPYEPHCHFGVELALHQCIRESSDFAELEGALQSHYDSIHGDDTTVAAAAIGFDGFDGMKRELEKRGEGVIAAWEKLSLLSGLLRTQNRTEEDVSAYLYTRTADKFEAISSALLPLVVEGREDSSIGEGLVSMLKEEQSRIRESSEKKHAEDALLAARKIKAVLMREPALAADMLCDTVGVDDCLSVAVAAVRRNAKDNAYLIAALEEKEKEYELLYERVGKRIYGEILERISYYRSLSDSLRGDPVPERRALRRRAIELEYTWSLAEAALADEQMPRVHSRLDGIDRELMKDLQCYLVRRGQLRGGALKFFRAKLRKNKEDCDKNVSYLFSLIEKNTAALCSAVRPEVLCEYGVTKPKSLDVIDRDELMRSLNTKMHEQKERAVGAIVASLAKNPDRPSVIDVYYNATRLASFRDFYLLKANPREDVREFESFLADFEGRFESLL